MLAIWVFVLSVSLPFFAMDLVNRIYDAASRPESRSELLWLLGLFALLSVLLVVLVLNL